MRGSPDIAWPSRVKARDHDPSTTLRTEFPPEFGTWAGVGTSGVLASRQGRLALGQRLPAFEAESAPRALLAMFWALGVWTGSHAG